MPVKKRSGFQWYGDGNVPYIKIKAIPLIFYGGQQWAVNTITYFFFFRKADISFQNTGLCYHRIQTALNAALSTGNSYIAMNVHSYSI